MQIDVVVREPGCLAELRLGPHRFYETVLAVLAASGRRHVLTGWSGRDGLRNAVAMLDDLVEALTAAGMPWKDVAQIVRIAAPVRPSPIGGLEAWRAQLAWFEGLWLTVEDADVALLKMPVATARHMLEGRPSSYVQLAEAFGDKIAAPVRD